MTPVSLGKRVRDALSGSPSRPRVFLHVGAMKTGTTYLQHLMDDNREQLAAHGILWPGETWDQQTFAAMDVMSSLAGRTPRNPAAAGMWDHIAGQMRDHTGPASVFSMEFLSYADVDQARGIVESFPDHDVHVVVTVRDARYSVPAQWQTSCRMAGVVPLRRVITALGRGPEADNPGRAARLLQRTQWISRMLEVWAPLVGPERTHVVTVPPKGSDPTLLWTRFASVIGVDPEVCTPPTSYIHTSLGHESTELLRLVNVTLGSRGRARAVRPVKRELVRHLLQRDADESPIRFNRRGMRHAARWNRQVRAAIEASGAQVVGDLDDLWQGPVPDDVPKDLDEPSAEDLMQVALSARDFLQDHRARLLAGTVERVDRALDDRDTDDHDAEDEEDEEDETGQTGAGSDDPWDGPDDAALRESVAEVAELLLECVEIRDATESPSR